METVGLADATLYLSRKPRCGKGYPGYTSTWQGTPQQATKKARPLEIDESGNTQFTL